MRSWRAWLLALLTVVAMLAAYAGPAMADDLNCRDAWGNWIRCDGAYYAPVDNSWWGNNWNNDWQGYNNYWGYPSYDNYWGYPSYNNWWDSDWDDA